MTDATRLWSRPNPRIRKEQLGVSAAKAVIRYEDFARLDLRVAQVVDARPHPNADRLLVLLVDVGELGQRQIVAGIREHYDPQQLVGTQVVVLVNLEEALIRGEESQGMLLAAESAGQPVLLRPESPCPPGSVVK